MSKLRTNSKQVMNQVNEHVLSYFDKNSGWNSDDAVANLKEQLKSFDYMPTTYAMGRYMAEGGTFLIYYHDIEQFLNGLGINPEGKEYKTHNTWELYQHLIGKSVERLSK